MNRPRPPPALDQCHVSIRYEHELRRKYGIKKCRQIAILRAKLIELDHYIDQYEDETPDIVSYKDGHEVSLVAAHVKTLEAEKHQVLVELGKLTNKPLVSKAQHNKSDLTWQLKVTPV